MTELSLAAEGLNFPVDLGSGELGLLGALGFRADCRKQCGFGSNSPEEVFHSHDYDLRFAPLVHHKAFLLQPSAAHDLSELRPRGQGRYHFRHIYASPVGLPAHLIELSMAFSMLSASRLLPDIIASSQF